MLGLDWRRLQFTSDLLPADVVGVSVFDRDTQQFQFRPGPVFTQLLLADEINRASPKAQSALLEAMEERQVSIDGVTHPLPEPFFVVATQNPHEQLGAFGLPESQLDRFLMRVSLGYPDREAERALLLAGERHELLEATSRGAQSARSCWRRSARCAPSTSAHRSSTTCRRWWRVRARCSSSGCRRAPRRVWCAPRRAGRCWPSERAVLPEHVQAVLPSVAAHRLEQRDGGIARPGRAPGRRAARRGAGAGLEGSVFDAPRRRLSRRVEQWARKRQGTDTLPLQLLGRRLYILPTRAGLAAALLLFVMLVAGLNYSNSLALFLTFMLAGFMLVGMHECQRTLQGLELMQAQAADCHAGDEGVLELRFVKPGAAAAPRPQRRARPDRRPANSGSTAAASSPCRCYSRPRAAAASGSSGSNSPGPHRSACSAAGPGCTCRWMPSSIRASLERARCRRRAPAG